MQGLYDLGFRVVVVVASCMGKFAGIGVMGVRGYQ